MTTPLTKIAINGLGRIGKLVLRRLIDTGAPLEVVLLNDLIDDPELHALLLEFDSVHGRWGARVEEEGGALRINDHPVRLTAERDLEALPLRELGVEMVIDCTGAFKSGPALQPYFDAGVKKVVVSAPVKDGSALNVVYGVNDAAYTGEDIVTAASCTTNCIAPVVKVLIESLGIRHASMTTIHDVTNTQVIVDKPYKDARRARSALTNLIPTTTGSATAITLIFPELKGKINGHAVRVPVLNGSLTDLVFEVERETSVEEVNALFKAASEGPLSGILGYEPRPLVSSDYRGDPRSTIIDAASTMVVNGTQVKVYAWYDNEWGYTCRLADVALMVAGRK